jgi:chemotaxis protein methyltransferase CheR
MAFTFFFRDEQSLTVAAQKLISLTMGRTNVHILNAGCAMGMETYTFAMILAENMGKFALRNVKIHAVDIDNENVDFGKTVTEGIYHKDHLQRIPEGLFNKYFVPETNGSYFRVSDNLRGIVTFHKHDLLTLKPVRNDFSLIICKNVLLHFSHRQRVEVLSMFHQILLYGGLLVMENTQNMPDELCTRFNRIVDYLQLYEKI